MKQEKSLKKNAVLNIIRNIMSIIFPIITFPYASRILLPDGIGKVSFANSIISYFSMLAGLGIGTYGCREVAKLRDKQNELNKFCSETLLINLTSTSAAYILLIGAIIAIPALHNYRLLIIIASLNIFLSTIGIGWVYGGLEEYEYITIRTIIFQIISIILIFALVRTKDDILIYIFISVISAAGSNILNLIHSRKFLKLKLIDKNLELKKHIAPIFKLFSITVFMSVYNILDTTMLGFLSTDEQVGFYSAATKINRMVLTLVTAISAVMFPRLSYYANNSREEDFQKLIQKNLSIIICISLPMVIGLNILSAPVILLFSGEKYIPAIPVMQLMNPIILILSLSNFIGSQVFIPLNKEKLTIRAVTIAALVNFTLNFLLIPKYNAYGAAIATVTAEVCVCILQIFAARKYINLKQMLKELLKYSLATLVMGIFVFLISSHINNEFANVLLCSSLGAFIYAIILFVLKDELFINIIMGSLRRLKK